MTQRPGLLGNVRLLFRKVVSAPLNRLSQLFDTFHGRWEYPHRIATMQAKAYEAPRTQGQDTPQTVLRSDPATRVLVSGGKMHLCAGRPSPD